MVCYTSCALSGVFLFSMAYLAIMVDKNYLKDDLMKMLTPELQEKYKATMKERRDLYLKGFIGGFVISLLAWIYLRNTYKLGGIQSACFLVAMTYIITYLYYTMAPKSDLFVVQLDDPKARAKWAEVYNYMKYNYHMSMLLGIVFVGFFGYGLC
jgi:hypothetical protein